MRFNPTKREVVMSTTALSVAILMTFLCLALRLQSKRPGLLLFVVAVPSIASTLASDRLLTWLGLSIPVTPAEPMDVHRYKAAIDQAVKERIAEIYQDALEAGDLNAAGFLRSRGYHNDEF